VYAQGRDKVREQNQIAKASNPSSYKLGEMAGGITSGIATAPYTMGIGGAIKEGVVRGLGESEGDIGTQVKDAAVGGALSGALAYGMPKVIDKANQLEGKARNAIGKTIFGVEQDATEAYLKDPEKFRDLINQGKDAQHKLMDQIDEAHKTFVAAPTKQAEEQLNSLKMQLDDAQAAEKEAWSRYKDYMKDRTQVGEDLKYKLDDTYDKTLNQPIRDAEAKVGEVSGKLANLPKSPDGSVADEIMGGVQELGKANSKRSGEMRQILADENVSIDKATALAAIDKKMESLLRDGQAPSMGEAAGVYNTLAKLRTSVEASENLTGSGMRGHLDDLGSASKFNPELRGAGKKLSSLYGELNNEILKPTSAKYAEGMGELAPDVNLHVGMSKLFGSPDKARRALEMASKPGNPRGEVVRRMIKDWDAKNGTNYLEQVNSIGAAAPALKSELDSAKSALSSASDKEQAFKLLRKGSSEKSLQSIVNDKSIEARDALAKFGSETGEDFMGALQPHINTRQKLNDPEWMNFTRSAAPETPELAKLNDTKGQVSKAEELLAQLKDNSKKFDRLKDTRTEGLLRQLKRGANEKGSRELEDLSALAGKDFNSQVDDLAVADQFLKDRTAGSRNVNMMRGVGGFIGGAAGAATGGLAGAGIGSAAGGALGGIAGKQLDQAGGKIWQSILDGNLKIGPYKKLFDEAMKSGPARVAMLHMTLSKTDPKYAALVEGNSNDQ
jgi:hypothetical protein